MYQTIQVSSCVSVQGEFVEALSDGQVVIRDGKTEYRGRPVSARAPAPPPPAALARGYDASALRP
jgi:hypothetical protein